MKTRRTRYKNFKEMHINKLSEDCLVYIFRNLPISDKFRIPLVCQKWRNLNKSYFNNVDKLRIMTDLTVSTTSEEMKIFKGNIMDLASFILETCGIYVNTIEMHHFNEEIDYLKLEDLILKNCGNIKALGLFDDFEFDNSFDKKTLFNDTMNSLLSKLPNITSITLEGLNLLYCRLTNLVNIKELNIVGCAFDSLNFDNLKNLKKCHINVSEKLNSVISALVSHKCENIEDFTLFTDIFSSRFSSDKLPELIFKQNKLSRVYLSTILTVDERIMHSLTCNL